MRGKSIEITQFEQNFIRDNCSSLTDDQILERLNVLRHRSQKPALSKAQITKKRQRMGIAKRGRGKLVNVRALASDLKFRGEYPPKPAKVTANFVPNVLQVSGTPNFGQKIYISG